MAEATPLYPQAAERSPDKVRLLDAETLGAAVRVPTPEPPESHDTPLDFRLQEDDTTLEEVEELLAAYGGVILTGPPGTSKSFYAAQVAAKLADGDRSRVRFLQFHPSYQYEDFVEGYVPRDDGSGFELKDKHLKLMCSRAMETESGYCVIVIDELSRGDPGRIFGEALTYIERTKRDVPFRLASGKELSIPANLVFIATMNPLDRGVDEVDAAFERRFAKVAMDPSETILRQFLIGSQMDEPLRERVFAFFRTVQNEARTTPYARVGHTFFLGARTEDDLRSLWNHQLRFLFEKAYRLDEAGYRTIRAAWERIFTSGSTAPARTAPLPLAEVPETTGTASLTSAQPETPAEAPEVGQSST